MGEEKRRQLVVQTQGLQALAVVRPGGRIHVQWDQNASATRNAQLTFFAEFLANTGLYGSWIECYPLSYSSPTAHSKRDVLGTWSLAKLAGHNRYAHITGLRGDAVSPRFWEWKNHQRWRATSLAFTHDASAKPGLACAPTPEQRARCIEHRVDPGHRHHHRAFEVEYQFFLVDDLDSPSPIPSASLFTLRAPPRWCEW